MAIEILSPAQKQFISLFSKNKSLKETFYLTGGSALAAYYLYHRHSEDLDFFSLEHIERPAKRDNICIDSLIDIAVTKVFTIYQNPRARDFIDLYCIFKKYKSLSLQKLLKMARAKFDSVIDPIQLGTQLLQAQNMQDLPRMFQKIEHQNWRAFFLNEAKNISDSIFKQ